MFPLLKQILDSATLWIYAQTIWIVAVSFLYYFTIPWIAWGSLAIFFALRLTRNPSSDPTIVHKVLGADPFILDKEHLGGNSQGNGKQYCMRVVAHRGGGYDYPENSLSAFKNSKEKGCTAVEFDLALTKDNIPIIFHDETIERLTGKTGRIKEMTWDQLNQLDIGENHPLREKFDGVERIALFDDILEECLRNGQHMFIDIKEKSLDIIQVILNAFNKHPELYERAVVSSFHPILIYMVRRKEPRIVTSLAWRPKFFSTTSFGGLDGPGLVRFKNPFKHLMACILDAVHEWALPRFTYYILGISAILLHKDVISPETIYRWRDRGIRVIAWTVNLPSEKLHFSRLLKITYMTDTLLAEKVT
ncbi:glycerophosphodiester phosphodiesterase 1 [Venturia canescens]|uniref:glycerophosphodiester phosphodiesterase 1 n=1 Tax=Venturia canescens TaxID=32260 RepID=UPI001C9CFAB1|nr:glycerophosphodiester phosphodiesterase 1 [Venturia canescens]